MRLAALVLSCLAVACAGTGVTPLPPGATEADVLQRWGPPTARHRLPDGQRLEYATGPYGEHTWMIDLAADGRVRGQTQVLSESNLRQVQGRLPGMARAELLRTLGTPGERRHGGRQGGEVWSWRFESPFCLWFQVSVGDDGIVRDGIFGPDPRCDETRLLSLH